VLPLLSMKGHQRSGARGVLPRHRKVSLPTGVARIGFDQLISNVEALAVKLKSACKIALRPLHIPQPFKRHRKVSLPTGVARIGFHQPISNHQALVVRLKSVCSVALRLLETPIFSKDNARYRCQPTLFGSVFVNRLLIARLSLCELRAPAIHCE
jgi:hypothetical protein